MTTNAGSSWSLIGAGFTDLMELKIMDATSVLVRTEGRDTTRVFKTTNGGSAWSELTYPDVGGERPMIKGLQALTETEIHLIAEHPTTNTGYVLSSNNGGSNWDTTNLSPRSYIDQIHRRVQVHSDSVFFYLSSGEMQISSNAGTSWDTTNFFLKGSFSGPHRVQVLHENMIMAACTLTMDSSKVFAVSRDFGKSWEWLEVKNSPFNYDYIQDISMIDSTLGYAIAWSGIFRYAKAASPVGIYPRLFREPALIIYPNPSKGIARLAHATHSKLNSDQLVIYNTLGVKMEYEIIRSNGGITEFMLSDPLKGLYFVLVNDGSAGSNTLPLIIE